MEQYHLTFKASNGYPSACELTIYRDIQLVVVSETGEGMSVTNANERIATEVVKQYGLDPSRMLFVEHYPESQRPKPYGESFDLVTFTWDRHGARNPVWRHLPKDEFLEILGTISEGY